MPQIRGLSLYKGNWISNVSNEFHGSLWTLRIIYVKFQDWIIILQENRSNHQKGKMIKIRVLIENDRSSIFDPIPDLLVGSMISRIQARHFYLISYFNSSPEISKLIDKIQ